MFSTVENNIAKVWQRIREAEEKFQRTSQSVQLMAVSKTRSAEMVREAAATGVTHVGENYLQEALEKIHALEDLDLCWHFIGPIQSNKTRPITEHFDWVHSVDRLKIAKRLSEQRPAHLPALNICLQVNISGEDSKSGFTPSALMTELDAICALPGICLRGLMVIPAPSDNFDEQRAAFADARRLFEALQQQHSAVDTLSMGMSGDLEAAIAEGATMVRIGTDIFGARPAKQ